MDELTPWSNSTNAADQRAAQVVASVAAIPPAAVDLMQWNSIVAESRRASPWRLVPAFAVSVALGVAFVVWLSPAPVVPEAPVLVASSDAVVTPKPGGLVRLERGRVSVDRATSARVLIETPHVTLDATRARFLAELVHDTTVVTVHEGEVIVRSAAGERIVRAGEHATWPLALEIPSTLTDQPAAATACDESAEGKRGCLVREAQGDGLAAQVALFELGRLELSEGHKAAAVDAFRSSLERFPAGVMHPEVRLALLVELTRQQRFSEALAVAKAFEASCATDPRVEEVRSLRRSLETR